MLSNIEEFCYIAKSTNAVVIGFCEFKLDASVLDPQISIDNYKVLSCDRNWQREGVVSFVRYDLGHNTLSIFPREVENMFFEILLPITNSKPITVGIIYRPLCQSNFLEVLNDILNKIDSVNNEIYILGDFNINLSLNDSYILVKKKYLK